MLVKCFKGYLVLFKKHYISDVIVATQLAECFATFNLLSKLLTINIVQTLLLLIIVVCVRACVRACVRGCVRAFE